MSAVSALAARVTRPGRGFELLREFGLDTYRDVEAAPLAYPRGGAARPGQGAGSAPRSGPITALLHPPARRTSRPARGPSRTGRPSAIAGEIPACRVHHDWLSGVPASAWRTRDTPCRSPACSNM